LIKKDNSYFSFTFVLPVPVTWGMLVEYSFPFLWVFLLYLIPKQKMIILEFYIYNINQLCHLFAAVLIYSQTCIKRSPLTCIKRSPLDKETIISNKQFMALWEVYISVDFQFPWFVKKMYFFCEYVNL
jgi:hypothetical protein